MEKSNFIRLLEETEIKDRSIYSELEEKIEFLAQERIKIIGNEMRSRIGIEEKIIDEERILKYIKRINEIAKEMNIDFEIDEKWDTVEKSLRLTILEDLSKEINSQKN